MALAGFGNVVNAASGAIVSGFDQVAESVKQEISNFSAADGK